MSILTRNNGRPLTRFQAVLAVDWEVDRHSCCGTLCHHGILCHQGGAGVLPFSILGYQYM